MTHVFNMRSRTFQRKHRARAAVGVQLNIDGCSDYKRADSNAFDFISMGISINAI